MADGSDVRTKLCAKGTNKAGVSYRVWQTTESQYIDSGESGYYQYRAKLDIQITTTKSCVIKGTFSNTYVYSIGRPDKAGYSEFVGTRTSTIGTTISASGTVNLYTGAWYSKSGAGQAKGFSGTITCGAFSASFSDSSPSGSF